jgi:hypothetical protein
MASKNEVVPVCGRRLVVEDVYDVTKSLISTKALEGMLAYTGLTAPDADEADPRIDGVLKVAASCRADGNGYLTLTFVLDVDTETSSCDRLREAFRQLEQADLSEPLGTDFEMLLGVPLDPFTHSKQFLIEELNLYFRHLAGRERLILEGRLLPLLRQRLGLVFEPLEWVDQLVDSRPSIQPGNQPGIRPGIQPMPPQAVGARLRHWVGYWLDVALGGHGHHPEP